MPRLCRFRAHRRIVVALPLLSLLLGAVIEGPRANASEPAAADASARAREPFLRGVALYDERSFSEALAAFRASLQLYESPNSQLYVARCLRELGRVAESVGAYEHTIELAEQRGTADPRYQDTASAAREELLAVRSRVGYVSVTLTNAPAETEVSVGTGVLSNTQWGQWLPVDAGQTLVVAKVGGVVRAQSVVSVAAGERSTVALLLPLPPVVQAPRPQAPASRSVWVYGTAGAALLSWASAATFAVLANNTHETLSKRCANGVCETDESDLVRKGRTYQTVTNVSLGLAAVTTGLCAWLWIRGPSIDVAASSDMAAIHVQGRF